MFKTAKSIALGALVAILVSAGIAWATWPSGDVNTTNLDSDTDSPLAARPDLFDLAQKFNQVRNHVTTFGQSLIDDVDAPAARSTLGLGSIATQAANSVAITGGSITGITDLAVADGGTGASTAAGARSNLGAAASGANTDITSLTGLTGDLSSTKACASGYTRIGPNYCGKNAYFLAAEFGSGCVQTTSLSGVTDAKGVLLYFNQQINSQNSVAFRTSIFTIQPPSDSTCVQPPQLQASGGAREFVATTSGTTIAEHQGAMIARSNSSGQVYVNFSQGGIIKIYVLGYFD